MIELAELPSHKARSVVIKLILVVSPQSTTKLGNAFNVATIAYLMMYHLAPDMPATVVKEVRPDCLMVSLWHTVLLRLIKRHAEYAPFLS